jgi:predicted AAA+ superfamily ATPase
MIQIYPRKLLKEVLSYLNSPQAIVITGIRRSGKTFLLKDIFSRINSSNKVFFDLENPLIRRIFEEENYEMIKTNLEKTRLSFKTRAFVFLDEIQWLRSIPSMVKYFIDHYQVKFFLTGSAFFYLKNLFSESLAGRKFIFELFPLSFVEFLIFKEAKILLPQKNERISEPTFKLIEPFWQEYLEFGSFPEVVKAESKSEKEKILQDIFSSYFQKEIEQLSDFRKTEKIRNLIILLAENIGEILNIERLSSELSVSRLTLEEWLSFLKSTYLIDLVPPYSTSERVAIRKAKKVYFVDWGLVNSISPLSLGKRLENCIFHLLRLKGKLSFYRKKSGVELDFILNKKSAYEAKVKATSFDQKKLQRLTKELRLRQGTIVTKDYSSLKDCFPGFCLG